ncbi:MAG TPA: T9SS type A sorting domain-containing protein [Bacteroidia bacterium]|nr:T9SS type A sorting domain-containing protein [Bacteroidia bacterium]
MKKLVVVGLTLINFVVAKSQAQSISTLPLTNTSICEGDNINISFSVNGIFNPGNTFVAELSDNIGGFGSPTNIGSILGTGSGNISATIPLGTLQGSAYRIRVKGTNPAVIGSNNGSDITINSLPIVSFAAPSDACINSSAIVLNGGSGLPVGGNGTYSGQGVFGGSFFPNLAGAGSFAINFTYIGLNGCVASASDNITVNNLPVVTLNPFASVCLNDPLFNLSGGLPIGGTYTIDGNVSSQFDPAIIGPGNHQITYSYTDANGCSASASQFIFVNQPPIISYNIPTSVCVGSTTNLLFSPSGGILLIDGTPSTGVFNASTAGNVNISYSYTDANTGCTTVSSFVITVNPLPSVTLPPTATYCNSVGNIILTGGTPNGGYYSGVGVLNDSIFYPSLIGGNNTSIQYNYTDGNGCTGSATQSITLSPAPIVSMIIPGIVCLDGGIVSLIGTPLGGTFSGIGVVGNTFNPSVSGLGTFNISYSFTDGNGCTAAINQNITVTTGSAPVLQAISPLCVNSNPVTFTYSPIGGTFTGNGVIGNSFDPSIAGVGTHEIIYSVTFANGCIGYDTINIIVNDLPQIIFTMPSQTCINGSNITLNTGLPVGGTYSGNGVTGNIFSPTLAGVGTSVITYTYTDVNSCTNFDTSSIVVNALPTVSLDTFDILCNGLTPINLVGGSPVGGTYAGSGVVGGTQFDPTLNGAGNFQITYIYTDLNGCTNTASQNLSVVNLSVNAGVDQTITCGNIAQLIASVNYSGTGNITYNWTPAQGLSNTNIANPTASPGVNTTYVVNVSDGVCANSDTVNVNYNPVSFGISFTASPISFNQNPPYVVNFTNPYASLGTYNFTWIFGDGFTQFNNAQNFSYTYYNNGVYTVTLIAQDILTGCIDTIPASFSINISGNNCTTQATINEVGPIIGCSGSPVLLTTNQIAGASYQWYFNGTVIGGANNSSYNCFYNGTQLSYSGFYSVLVTDPTNNCVSMSNVVQVIFNQPPVAPIITIIDPFDPCTPNNTATLQANSGYASYEWYKLISPNLIGSQQTITITQTGVYEVIVTDNNGCTNSSFLPIANFGPDPSAICFVTVDKPSQHNYVFWTNPVTTVQLDSFLLLRKSDIQFGFDTIATFAYDATATYYSYEDLDTISLPTYGLTNDPVNPAAHYYTYGLALKDVCGGTSIPTLFHTTINLLVTTIDNGASYNLSWNAYGGLPFGIFELHKETSTNPDLIFDNVSSNIFNYTDNNTSPDSVIAYWITVPLSDICDTSRAVNGNSTSNIVRRDVFGGIDGLNKNSEGLSKFEIIPNPNNGNFVLTFKNDFKNKVEIDIISAMGTTVWSNKILSTKDNLKVDLPELSQGVYLIQVKENNRKHYKKMIVNK